MAVPCITRLRLALACAFILLAPGMAWAQDGEEAGDEAAGVLLGVRGVGEVWQDSSLILDVGRSSRFGGAGALSYRVWRMFSADFEAGYHRMSGLEHGVTSHATGTEATSFEMVPLVFAVGANHQARNVEVFANVGSAVTIFSSTHPEAGTISGTKFGLSVQGGVRIDTGLVQPSIRRDANQPVKAVDLEIMIGRRQHQLFGVGDGLNLSAWRVGVGLFARM
jgi:hypothetical protein